MPKNRFGFARANSLQTTPVIQLLLAGTLALGIGAAGHYLYPSVSAIPAMSAMSETASLPAPTVDNEAAPTMDGVFHSAPVEAMASASRAMAAAIKPVLSARSETATREIEIRRGVNFADLLMDADVVRTDALAATSALAKVYDLRRLKSGQSVILSFSHTGTDENLNTVSFQPEAAREVTIARNQTGGFTARFEAVPITREHFAARAEIHSTLYEAGEAAHVPYALMASFMRIYSHEIDFQRDIRPGDRFEILYDRPVTKTGEPAGEGNIIYAALTVGGKVKPVYRVTFGDGTADYFDERGESVRRALLRTPVAAAHITSGFGMRINPILGYSMMHKGVDFGAPEGSPIFAAGNGIVVEIGRKGSYGRYIRVRHNNRLETVYAHMSRFNQSLIPRCPGGPGRGDRLCRHDGARDWSQSAFRGSRQRTAG